MVSRIREFGLGRRLGLGQHAGRLILCRQPALRLFSSCDIVENDNASPQRVVFVPQRAAGDEDIGPVVAAGICDVELGLVGRLAAYRPHQRQVLHGVGGQSIGQEDFVAA